MPRTVLLLALTLVALTAAPQSLGAQVSSGTVPADSVKVALDVFGLTPAGIQMNGRFSSGNTKVSKGDTLKGPLVVIGGSAEVYGTVAGDVFALWGDVVVHQGAEVYGSASAYRGRVIVDGGRVRGTMEAWPAAVATAARTDAPPLTRMRALQLGTGWTAMLVVIGILVLVLLSSNLEATARVLEQDFGRAFFVGVLGQLGFLPALLLLCVALVLTIVGILLVPFALVAAPVAFAGFVTLGWLAIALVTGRAVLRAHRDGSSRAEALRSLTLGVVLLMMPWILVAALQGSGAASIGARIIALAITWAAGTAGLGAALLSRGGAGRRKDADRPQPPMQSWQTPTPVAGVAAARRPIPARPGATPK